MGFQEPDQEWLDAYRYQAATMAYAAGIAHYHRLPAMRSVFRPLMKALITEMLKREVWGHWYLTSQPGAFVDPDLKKLRKPWVDPVCRGNIMVCAIFMFYRRLSPLTNVSTLGIYFW
jgi:Linalool dehydratase/isomerase